MLYLAEYYIRWVATSHDNSRDQLARVVIEAPSWEDARKTLVAQAAVRHGFQVEFQSLSLIVGTVLWK